LTPKMLDERDVSAACVRFFGRTFDFLAQVNRQRLEREYEEMRVEVDALIAKLATVHQREYLKLSDAIDRLWKRMDANSDERFGPSPKAKQDPTETKETA
jgi:hypothetical protein